jgi:large subunit ribosomal protein L22e
VDFFVLILPPLQYLTQKYLKKQQLRDFLRVLATNKTTYILRYYKMSAPTDDKDE